MRPIFRKSHEEGIDDFLFHKFKPFAFLLLHQVDLFFQRSAKLFRQVFQRLGRDEGSDLAGGLAGAGGHLLGTQQIINVPKQQRLSVLQNVIVSHLQQMNDRLLVHHVLHHVLHHRHDDLQNERQKNQKLQHQLHCFDEFVNFKPDQSGLDYNHGDQEWKSVGGDDLYNTPESCS